MDQPLGFSLLFLISRQPHRTLHVGVGLLYQTRHLKSNKTIE